jgi:hypothetical protein
LDVLDITSTTIVIGDFNAASPSCDYNYYNHAGRTVEEFLNSQKIELVYNPEDKNIINYPFIPPQITTFTKRISSKINTIILL